jgi:nicotinate-nucleotide--dimethylbenzimidazole phosphoribosyltransferase
MPASASSHRPSSERARAEACVDKPPRPRRARGFFCLEHSHTHGPGESRLQQVIGRVAPLEQAAQIEARRRQDQLTKPPGSLGRLERLAIQVAGITGDARPRLAHKLVIVVAGDHGVAAEGVSAYPSEVTGQMVRNFASGGAAINVLARRASARVVVVDVGVAEALPQELPIVHRKVAPGTANMALGPAMTHAQALQAIAVGLDVVDAEFALGVDVICLGEMGIGNTTAASAIVASLTTSAVADVTGRGTGIDDAAWQHKVEIIEQALRVNRPDGQDALDVLAKVGGLEIAALVGVILGSAARRLPVIVDGFITTAAALVAVALCPAAQSYLIAAHRSVERGHAAALEHLELEPLLMLDMRLGEGTGAALALPIVDAALALLDEMATFEDAGISGVTSPALVADC